jgi:hypothetical protein
MSELRYPNESREYRDARNSLLKVELGRWAPERAPEITPREQPTN